MRAAALKWVVGFGISMIGAVDAHAQPLSAKTESIESTVVNADLVLTATLVSFRRTETGPDRDGHEATIAIEETIKQRPFREDPYQKLSLHIPQPASVLEEWKERSSRLLVAYDRDAPKQTAVIELTPDKVEVMTADVKLVRDPDALVRLARTAVSRLPANVRRVYTFDLQVAREVVAGTSWEKYYDTGGHLRLSVPADQHLEKKAQDYIRSANPHRRSEGVRALVYFQSDETLALVKPLVNDQGITYSQPADGENAGYRIYGVRHAAYETLKAWGIEVEEPVYREAVR